LHVTGVFEVITESIFSEFANAFADDIVNSFFYSLPATDFMN